MSTMLDKIWEAHVVERAQGKPDLLYVDRHLIHEVTSPQAFEGLRQAGRKVRRPDLTFAVVDHVTPTCAKRVRPLEDAIAEDQLAALERNTAESGISFFNMDDPRQGVIHVTMPERGITLPGLTIMCGDSHTATHGAFGALAFGIGTSEVEHILASQTLYQSKPKTMAVKAAGRLGKGVYAKDLVLHIIGILGAGGGTGYAIEFMGEAVEALSMEARMTLCNMAIECGAKSGMVAPDQTTFDWIEGRANAPKGENFARAVAEWKKLKSDSLDEFDHVIEIDAGSLAPQATWGINPGQESALDAPIPAPESFADADERKACAKALEYQGLKPGMRLVDASIDYAFIGSCTNGRIEDLRIAAAIAKGRRVAEGVTALVVPGSGLVKAQAVAEGLDKIFTEAGFQWREPGCSMCLAMNPDVLPAGKRCASTSNRNFEDRQGRGGRTHLVSPASAAAAAIAGHFVDPREMIQGGYHG